MKYRNGNGSTLSGEKDLQDQSNEDLHLLLNMIDGINRSAELKTLLAESMEATRLLMNSEASSLMLLDEDTGELYVSFPTGPVKDEIKGYRIPKYKGIGGWVVENKLSYLSNDLENTEPFFGELTSQFQTKSIICVPLLTQEGRILGVAQAVNKKDGEKFTKKDVAVFQVLASHISVSIERAQEIEELYGKLKDKEILLTEIHHRVKNNLASIISLLELEADEVEDEKAKKIIDNTYTRLQSMTQVHDLLCQKGLFEKIELGLYVRKLVDKTINTVQRPDLEVNITVEAATVNISANKALLCGIVLNELLVNIYKHAFGSTGQGEIQIHLFHKNDTIFLEVEDNGVGLPDNFTLDTEEHTIGIWIVNALTQKLNGEISYNSKKGSLFRISFPV